MATTTFTALFMPIRRPVAAATQHVGAPQRQYGCDGTSSVHDVLQSLVRPLCPGAHTLSRPQVESGFSAQAARPDTTTVGHAAERACPISPRRCPFGGACHSCPVRVQTKLTVNEPGDSYEQEAERIADQVMRMPEPRDTEKTENPGTTDIGVMSMQGQATDQVDSTKAPPIVHEVLRSSGQPLDPATRAFMEPRFAYDFSQVRVHTDAQAAASAQAVGALAYTVGRDVVFGAGQYTPQVPEGKQLLAHELVHAVQQSAAGQTQASVIMRDLAQEPPEDVPAQHDLTAAQVRAATVNNRKSYKNVSTRLIQEIVGAPQTGHFDDVTVRLVALPQRQFGLVPADCRVGATYDFLIPELRAEGVTPGTCLTMFRVVVMRPLAFVHTSSTEGSINARTDVHARFDSAPQLRTLPVSPIYRRTCRTTQPAQPGITPLAHVGCAESSVLPGMWVWNLDHRFRIRVADYHVVKKRMATPACRRCCRSPLWLSHGKRQPVGW